MATTEINIRAEPAEVFDVLADGWSYADWVVGAKDIRDVDESFPALGSRLHHRVGAGPATIDDVTEVVEVEDRGHLRLRASAGPLGKASVDFRLEPIPTGTRVLMHEVPIGDDRVAELGRKADRALRVRNAETLWRLKTVAEARATGNGSAQERGAPAPTETWRPLADATARLFATLATLRADRAFHTRGVTLTGTAELLPAGAGLAGSTTVPVIVRLSRGVGVPSRFPDFNGIAVRFVDAHGEGAHQDILLVSSSEAPVLRHVLRPVRRFSGSGFSTILPYRNGAGGLVLFSCPPLAVTTLDGVADDLPLHLSLRVASLVGPWEDAAIVTLTGLHEKADSVRFDPWNTGPTLRPAGLLNRLRAPAYAASRAAAPWSDDAS